MKIEIEIIISSMNEQKHLKRAVTQAKGCLTLFFSPDIYFFPFYSLFEIFREKEEKIKTN